MIIWCVCVRSGETLMTLLSAKIIIDQSGTEVSSISSSSSSSFQSCHPLSSRSTYIFKTIITTKIFAIQNIWCLPVCPQRRSYIVHQSMSMFSCLVFAGLFLLILKCVLLLKSALEKNTCMCVSLYLHAHCQLGVSARVHPCLCSLPIQTNIMYVTDGTNTNTQIQNTNFHCWLGVSTGVHRCLCCPPIQTNSSLSAKLVPGHPDMYTDAQITYIFTQKYIHRYIHIYTDIRADMYAEAQITRIFTSCRQKETSTSFFDATNRCQHHL